MNNSQSDRAAKTIFLSGLILFASACLATTDRKPNIALSDLAGNWESHLPAFGQPAHSTLRWHPVLNGKFMRLDYEINSVNDPNTTPIFAGVGYYQESDSNSYQAFWADSGGELHPISAAIEGNTLMSTWGVAGGKLGRTYYTLSDPGRLEVTDWLLREDGWKEFNRNVFSRADQTGAANKNPTNGGSNMEKVTGIGGIFFRAKDTAATSQWYADNLGINLPPQDYGAEVWRQEAGVTVFSPFEQDTTYFGDDEQQWMINFRVRDLDAIVAQLRKQGNEVEVETETYPNGRFARTKDPEGTPIQLWEPNE